MYLSRPNLRLITSGSWLRHVYPLREGHENLAIRLCVLYIVPERPASEMKVRGVSSLQTAQVQNPPWGSPISVEKSTGAFMPIRPTEEWKMERRGDHLFVKLALITCAIEKIVQLLKICGTK